MGLNARMIRGAVIAAIVLVVLGAASATPWVVTLTLPRFGTDEPPELDVPRMTLPPQEPADTDPVVAVTMARLLIALLVVAVTAIVGYLLFRLVKRLRDAWRPEDAGAETDQPGKGEVLGEVIDVDIASLATAIARAEAHLAGMAEPSDAVTAAWVALEDEAALQGTPRDPAQTTTEFTTEFLRHTPAPIDAVTQLRTLYHKVRFTSRPATLDDVRHARASLARIAEAIDATILIEQQRAEGPS